jgi:hypothetical protein
VFGIVAAGEVHPQPQFLMFDNVFTLIFLMVGTIISCGATTCYKKQLFAALGKWMNSGVWLHCSSILFNEQWSMLYYSGRTGPVQS